MDPNKLDQIILLLSNSPKVKDLGLTKLWKLIYFMDVRALRETGFSITGSEFIKYEHGPVPSRGDKRLKSLLKSNCIATRQRNSGNFTLNEVVGQTAPDVSVFSDRELGLIDAVMCEFGSKTAGHLSELSHREPAWHYAAMLQKLSPQLMTYGTAEDPEGL